MTTSIDQFNPTRLILTNREQWSEWYQDKKDYAEERSVWAYFDPELEESNRPKLPVISEPPDDGTTSEQIALYNIRSRHTQLTLESIRQTRNKIVNDLSIKTRSIVVGQPRQDILKILQKQYKPTDDEEDRFAYRKYEAILKQPVKGGKISAWLEDFDNAYNAILKRKLPESNDRHVKRNFLKAIAPISYSFADRQAELLNEEKYTNEDFRTLLGRYRTYLANSEGIKPSGNLAFTTFHGQTHEEPKKEKGTGPTKPCVCGLNHYFQKCWYLMESQRRPDWSPNEETEAKVKEALSKDTKLSKRLRHLVEEDQRQLKKQEKQGNSNNTQPTKEICVTAISHAAYTAAENPQEKTVFIEERKTDTEQHRKLCMAAVFNAGNSNDLKTSFILDSGATSHICNDRSRFEDFDDTPEKVDAGETTIKTGGKGKVKIYPDALHGSITMTLTNVKYIPGMLTNIVSAILLKNAGYTWDFDKDTIKEGNKTLFKLHNHYTGLWLVEKAKGDTYAFATQRSAMALLQKGNMDIWHRRMAHTHVEALKHLPEAATGIEITDIDANHQVRPLCETCKISYAPQQISRRPMMSATQPFERVHFDLINMQQALSGERWITHFYDEATRLHFVYTHTIKSDCITAVKALVEWARNTHGRTVKILKSDQEQTLGTEIKNLRTAEGIVHQYAVKGTPNQNGAAERAGYQLVLRTRKALLGALLPADLWPSVLEGTTFITNRTPMRALDWKTPWETLTGKKPNLSCVYTIGCLAYTRQEQPKRAKMAPRAYRGIHLGAVASNIWNIWNPKTRRIEPARDVQFNEAKMYDPTQPFLEDLLVETSPEPPIPVFDNAADEAIPIPEEPDPVEENSGSNLNESADARNNGDSMERGDQNVKKNAKPDQACGGFQDDNARYMTPPQTSPEATPTPAIPGTFIDDTDVRSSTPIQGSPGGVESDVLQNTHRDLPEDHDSPSSSRSGGGEIHSQIDTSNIIPGKRHRQARRDQGDFKAHALFEAPFIEEPERVEYAFALAADTAESFRKRWHRSDLPNPPETYAQIQRHPLKDEFLHATRIEINKIEDKEAYTVVKEGEAENAQILPLKWVFTYKFDKDGYLIKAKGRICVRGDLEREAISNNYAATASAKSFRAVMALVAAFDMDIDQKDAVNAFLNATLQQPVYTKAPEGFRVKGKIWKLKKALYGLRKSPRLWQQDLATTLLKFGLLPVPEEECLYTNDYMIVLVYVDDIIIANLPNTLARNAANLFKEELAKRYELQHLGEATWFLGVRILRDRPGRKIWLCQDSYAEHIAIRFHLEDLTRWPQTPLSTSIDLRAYTDPAEIGGSATTYL